jgi:hypothetical protein
MPTRVSCRINGVISYTGLLKANLLLYFGLPQKSYLASSQGACDGSFPDDVRVAYTNIDDPVLASV